MERVRTPACDAIPLSNGALVTSGPVLSDGNSITQGAYKNQQKNSGNRWGHDKNNFKKPAFYESINDGPRRPYVIQESIRRTGILLDFKCLSRNSRRRLFRNFSRTEKEKRMFRRNLSLLEKEECRGLLFHRNKTGQFGRAKRSENVEASVSLIITEILYHLDLHTMAYGYRDANNQPVYFNYYDLEENTGLPYSKIKRMMSGLQEEGYITVKTTPKLLESGRWITIETQIHLTDKIFKWLDLENQLLKDRRYANNENFKKQCRIDQRNRDLQEYSPSKKQEDKMEEKIDIKKTVPFNRYSSRQSTIAQNKHILDMASKLMADNPGMTGADAIKIAAERNKSPPN